MKIMSFSPFGYEGALVTIEVDLRRGIPAVDMVGLADNAVRESRERMRAAIRNSGFEFPVERVLISLSPADVKKEGAGFDLAIALAVLHKKEHPEYGIAKDAALVMGELELSGRIRAVRGVHAALSTAREYGIRNCIIPAENAAEASVFSSMKVFPVRFLTDAFELFSKLASESEQKDADVGTACTLSDACANTTDEPVVFSDFPPQADYREISGQGFLIEALQIAAAGRHNLIAYGPPGCGKTLALSRFYTLLPRLTHEEALTVTRIYSIAGLLTSGTRILQDPPFRMPHQSSTAEGIIGGGMHCRPGEISLAHNGVLFLDEAADFRISVLQALRVPLEEGKITLSRAGRSTEYPAHFQLLLAANPCPCGNFGSMDKICLCRPQAVEQYWRRFSAPLLDRIDIRVALIGSGETAKTGEEERDADGFFSAAQRLSTAQLRKTIADATAIQRKRQGKPNARLEAAEIRQFCPLGEEAERFLTESARRFAFSARGIHSCIKLARTCADTEKSARIQKHHMEKAVLFHRNAGGIHMMF
ncbi:MAG: YifB family Mg chelatase-like AAA ATPase [Treponema maltophilum]